LEALVGGVGNTLAATPASIGKLEPSPGQNSRGFIALQTGSVLLGLTTKYREKY